MLDDNPVLKQRLIGIAAVAAIGLGGVAAVDLMLTGGFDFGSGHAIAERDPPSAYVRVVQAAQSFGDSVRAISWDEALIANADAALTDEELVGADDGAPAPERFDEASGEDLYERIAALYSDDEASVESASYEDAPAYDADAAYPQDAEPAHSDEYAEENKADVSAYETESPW